MVTPDAVGILLLVLASRAVSLRASLLCILVVAVTAMPLGLIDALLKRRNLALPSSAAALCALGIGHLTSAALGHLFGGVPAVTEPTLAALLVAAGCAVVRTPSLPVLMYPSVVVIGTLRELLADGVLWDVSFFSGFGTFTDVTGGMLIAAVILCLFGLSHPVLHVVPFLDGLLPAALAVILGVVCRFLPLSPLYTLWSALAAVTVIEALLPAKSAVGAWLVTVPFVVLHSDILPFLAVFAVTIIVSAALVRRLRLFPPLRRFGGAPCTAVITAIARSIVSAVF